MTPSEYDRHDEFMHLNLPCEEAMRGFVRSLVPTMEDAREVMQNVAAVLCRKSQDISSPDDFRRWAFGVARFDALDFLRSVRRDRRVFGAKFLPCKTGPPIFQNLSGTLQELLINR